MKFKPSILTVLLLAISICALAQDKPALKAADDAKPVAKAAPAEVTISAETIKTIESKNAIARLAQLEAENLLLRLQQMEEALKNGPESLQKLREAAKRATEEAGQANLDALTKAGIPEDKIKEYEQEKLPDGGIKLKLKKKS